MRSLVLAVSMVAALATRASAMGSYVQYGVVAWNADGTAALMTETSSSSGTEGSGFRFIVVGARDAAPYTTSFDDTQNPDDRHQKIDVRTCIANAAALKRTLATHRFRGVTVRASHCKTDREVVAIDLKAAATMESSHVGDLTQRRATTALDLRIEAAVTRALGDIPVDADVVSLTGALVIVLSGVNGDESFPAHAAVISATQTSAKIVVEDLRIRA
jgi:hypothetical protein